MRRNHRSIRSSAKAKGPARHRVMHTHSETAMPAAHKSLICAESSVDDILLKNAISVSLSSDTGLSQRQEKIEAVSSSSPRCGSGYAHSLFGRGVNGWHLVSPAVAYSGLTDHAELLRRVRRTGGHARGTHPGLRGGFPPVAEPVSHSVTPCLHTLPTGSPHGGSFSAAC